MNIVLKLFKKKNSHNFLSSLLQRGKRPKSKEQRNDIQNRWNARKQKRILINCVNTDALTSSRKM